MPMMIIAFQGSAAAASLRAPDPERLGPKPVLTTWPNLWQTQARHADFAYCLYSVPHMAVTGCVLNSMSC